GHTPADLRVALVAGDRPVVVDAPGVLRVGDPAGASAELFDLGGGLQGVRGVLTELLVGTPQAGLRGGLRVGGALGLTEPSGGGVYPVPVQRPTGFPDRQAVVRLRLG